MLCFEFQLISRWPKTTSKRMIRSFWKFSTTKSSNFKRKRKKRFRVKTPKKIIAAQNLEQNNQVYFIQEKLYNESIEMPKSIVFSNPIFRRKKNTNSEI